MRGLVLFAIVGCKKEGDDSGAEPNDDDSSVPGVDDDADDDGYTNGQDCDDHDAAVSPAATEVCDDADTDEDCDGLSDDEDDSVDLATAAVTLYADADADTYGATSETVTRCDGADGYVERDGDCDDTDGTVHPGATEVCRDGTDNNCDPSDDVCELEGDLLPGDADATLLGAGELLQLGWQMAAAGDVNGDGIADLAAGTYYGATGYVFFGPVTSATVADASARVRCAIITGVQTIGDQDSDGYGDLVFYSPQIDDQRGRAYIVMGPVSGNASADSLASATISGVDTPDSLGWSAATGDLNADGTPDLALGAIGHPWGAGSSYAFFGPFSGDLTLSDADASFSAVGAYDIAGDANASDGDIDGDGVDDLVVTAMGAMSASTDGGMASLFYGPVSGAYELASPDVTVVTTAGRSRVGQSASIGGDLDADGRDDLAVGWYDGLSVFYADAVDGATTLDVDAGDAVITSDVSADQLGLTLDTAGDLDGDGFADLVAGAPWGTEDKGQVLGFYGPVSGVATASAAAGFRVLGVAENDQLGIATGFVGDVRDNGTSELAVGAYGVTVDSHFAAGAVFLYDGAYR